MESQKKLSLVVVATIFLCLASDVEAASTGYAKVAWVKYWVGHGIEIALVGFVNDPGVTGIDCGRNTLLLPKLDADFEERYALVLIALATGQQISFAYYGCYELNPDFHFIKAFNINVQSF